MARVFCLKFNTGATECSNFVIMPYPEMMVAPMRAELTNKGFTELKSASEVEAAMNGNNDTTLVVVN